MLLAFWNAKLEMIAPEQPQALVMSKRSHDGLAERD